MPSPLPPSRPSPPGTRRTDPEAPVLERRRIPSPIPLPVLALGGDQKSRFGLAEGGEIALGPDFGDLRDPANFLAYRRALTAACRAEKFVPRVVAGDLHPAYASSRLAPELAGVFSPPARVRTIQHHHAHLAAVLAETGRSGPAIGVIWDGTGYGTDGAAWGGEFLVGSAAVSRRAAHLEYVPLLGGEKAVREPWRMAFSYLHLCGRLDAFPDRGRRGPGREERDLLREMLEKKINSPPTSSMGRLFDGVSALLGTGWVNDRPGAAAVALEAAAATGEYPPYPFGFARSAPPAVIELAPLITAILADLEAGRDCRQIAARFHSTVVAVGVQTVEFIAGETGIGEVVLGGGVFYNRLVRERLVGALRFRGLEVLLPAHFDIGDGGLALGQAAAAAAA